MNDVNKLYVATNVYELMSNKAALFHEAMAIRLANFGWIQTQQLGRSTYIMQY